MTDPGRARPAAPPRPAAGRPPEAGPSPDPPPPPSPTGAPRVHAEIHTIPPEWIAWSPPPPAAEETPSLPAPSPPLPALSPPLPALTPPLPTLTPSAPLPRSDAPPIVVGRDHRVLARFQRDDADPEVAALRSRETLPGDPLAVAVTPTGPPVLSEPPAPGDGAADATPGARATDGVVPPPTRARSHLGLGIAIATGTVVGAVIAGLLWLDAPAASAPTPREQAHVLGTRPAYVVRDANPAAARPSPPVDPAPDARAVEGTVTVGAAAPVEVEAADVPRATAPAPRPAATASPTAAPTRASAAPTPADPASEPPPAATGSSGPRLRLVRPRGTLATEGDAP